MDDAPFANVRRKNIRLLVEKSWSIILSLVPTNGLVHKPRRPGRRSDRLDTSSNGEGRSSTDRGRALFWWWFGAIHHQQRPSAGASTIVGWCRTTFRKREFHPLDIPMSAKLLTFGRFMSISTGSPRSIAGLCLETLRTSVTLTAV